MGTSTSRCFQPGEDSRGLLCDSEIFAKVLLKLRFPPVQVWAYLTASIVEPVAFVNKKSSGVSRVVVFTVLGVQGVYDRYNLMFAIQVGSMYVLVLQKVTSELHPKVRNHGEGPNYHKGRAAI